MTGLRFRGNPAGHPEREYIREKSLGGQAPARDWGRHSGRPKVFYDAGVRKSATGDLPTPPGNVAKLRPRAARILPDV
ncbi:hypothetical protein [Streptomyces sp. ME18-1-4]|uniref:hypothetical protein n=1 Tax=Streptomyces sp. ME18-1-4 TaxID=3028685 RepID=UPI0029A8826E|nr:hypothetical protein [Streptomyces sp. ME18-1-4]MDX3241987.1 hypothetical protein [Streptomyces sp. ME18-1-4]